MHSRIRTGILALACSLLSVAGISRVEAQEAAATADSQLSAGSNRVTDRPNCEEVFEFTQKPAVTKQGDKVIVAFTSRGKCDATVAIVGSDGRIVRHLASGVLGRNAPAPFQVNSLQQSIEWDGLDDQGRDLLRRNPEDGAGDWKVRVGLGLQARYVLSIAWHSHDLAPVSEVKGVQPRIAVDANGFTYVAVPLWLGWHGRVYDKAGNYVRTFWPPSASDLDKFADRLYGPGYILGAGVPRATVWGDKVYSGSIHGPFESSPYASKVARDDIDAVIKRAAGGITPAPGEIPMIIAAKSPPAFAGRGGLFERLVGTHHWCRLAVDRRTDELYTTGRDRNFQDQPVSLFRLDGKTGKLDETWFPKGEFRCVNAQIGPDGLVYARIGAFGQWIVKLDHSGKPVNFGGDAVDLPHGKYPDTGETIAYADGWSPALKGLTPKVLWGGGRNAAYVQERGLYVSPCGLIAASVDFGKKHEETAFRLGLPADVRSEASFVRVWDASGKLLTANAVGDMQRGHGIGLDRDGNLYAALAAALPRAQVQGENCTLFGLAQPYPKAGFHDMGTLLKFKGGNEYPLSATESLAAGAIPSYGAAALSNGRMATRVQWAWGGLDNQAQHPCSCHHVRYDMDYFARHWIPANYLNSVLVLDSNGNLIARLGCYGNVDDSESDVKEGRDGLRFAWMKAVAVSDTSLYVADRPNRRILRAELSYRAEALAPVPNLSKP